MYIGRKNGWEWKKLPLSLYFHISSCFVCHLIQRIQSWINYFAITQEIVLPPCSFSYKLEKVLSESVILRMNYFVSVDRLVFIFGVKARPFLFTPKSPPTWPKYCIKNTYLPRYMTLWAKASYAIAVPYYTIYILEIIDRIMPFNLPKPPYNPASLEFKTWLLCVCHVSIEF